MFAYELGFGWMEGVAKEVVGFFSQGVEEEREINRVKSRSATLKS